ncbi:MAG: MFS transporter, partial [Acidimicrobiia bacterium]
AAVLSPVAGPITDRIGGTWAVRLTMLVAAVGYPLVALADSTLSLAAATLPIAFAQALINPATNAIIAHHVPDGRRGVITGIKQSGVYVGFVLVGLTAPALTARFGWEAAFLLLAGVCLLGFVLSLVGLPPTAGSRRAASGGVPRTAFPDLRRLTIYAGLMGFAASTNNFIPLYAETALGYTNAVAGLITAVIGGLAIVTRILGARRAERTGRPGVLLRAMAAMGVVTNASLALAALAPAMVWLAAASYAFGLAPWNAVAMLAVIILVGRDAAGTATGWVVGAFSAGLALGPVAYGRLIDSVGFGTAWGLSAVMTAAAVVAVAGFRAQPAVRT